MLAVSIRWQLCWNAWKEWNGKFRDDIRSFMKGDGGTVTNSHPSHRQPRRLWNKGGDRNEASTS